MPMFMVLSSWQSHCGVQPVHLMNVERREAAADPQTKPNDLGCESACRHIYEILNLHGPYKI